MWLYPTSFSIVDGSVLYTNRPINSDHIVTFDDADGVAIEGVPNNIDKSNHASGHHIVHEANPTSPTRGAMSGHPLIGKFPAIQFFGVNNDWFWFYKSTKDRDKDLEMVEKELRGKK